MIKIPMDEAVSSGAWFECSDEDREVVFRFRVISFSRVELKDIDEPEEIELDINQGWLYLMKCQVVNLAKSKTNVGLMADLITVVDQDDCIYEQEEDDYHLIRDSSFAQKSGLYNFYGVVINPKMQLEGAILFHLPKEEGAFYYLGSIGDLREI